MQKIYEIIKRIIKQEMKHESIETQEKELYVKEFVPTGFSDIDKSMQGGLKRGELVVIEARPSMGKTSLAMNIAHYVAANEHMPSVLFSLDMDIE